MPKRYEAIRDACIKKGGGAAGCKTKAAKIENSLRKKEGKAPAKFHRGWKDERR